MNKKNSQITVFIILGMSLLIITGLVLYVESMNYERIKEEKIKQGSISTGVSLLNEYIVSCLEKNGKSIIAKIAKNGGLANSKEYRYFNGKRYSYLCRNIDSTGCSPVLLFRQDIEDEISREIEKNIGHCVDFKVFEDRGYEIKKGKIKAETRIGSNTVLIKINWPIIVKKENSSRTTERFSANIKEPLGELFSLANDIINNENSNGNFDIISFMLYSTQKNTKNNIIIEKHRPFPDIVYSLKKKDIEFNFALAGKEKKPSIRKGCCYNVYDKMCYENSQRQECYEKNGIYDPTINCECPKLIINNKTPNIGYLKCKNNSNAISWCSYGSLTGNGYDMPGTRHYMHYCIEGKEHIEECRDYRQEICVENNIVIENRTYKKAECRENRWQSCKDCKTEECCNNKEERDCYWTNYSVCVPEVPVGIKFWEKSDVCEELNAHCSVFGCTEDEKLKNKELCAMQSDCGYGSPRTVKGKKSLKENNKKIRNTKILAEKKSISIKADEFSKALALNYNILDYYYNFPISKVLNPFFDISKIGYNTSSFCRSWQPNSTKKCSSCGNNAIFCSEYRCRSLGNCIYGENKGVPHCYENPKIKKDIKISIGIKEKAHKIMQIDKSENEFNSILGKSIDGYKITPKLNAYEKATILINTSERTICSAGIGPDIDTISFDSYYFDNRILSKNHNITISFPYVSEKPEAILKAFNVKSVSQLIKKLSDPSKLVDSVYKRYKEDFDYYTKETGTDIYNMLMKKSEEIKKAVEKKKSAKIYLDTIYTIAKGFESNRNYIFITCKDNYDNKKSFFIQAEISKSQAKPKIIALYPKNNSAVPYNKTLHIIAFLSEPSECRYSIDKVKFEKMNKSFDCQASAFSISPYYKGSYICDAELKMPFAKESRTKGINKSIIYIRCKSNPEIKKSYSFNINKGSECSIDKIRQSKFINISCNNNIADISFALNMLQKPIRFNADAQRAKIVFYADKEMKCSYIINSSRTRTGNFNAKKSEKSIALGLFEYDAEISLQKNTTVEIVCKGKTKKQRIESIAYEYWLRKSEPLKIIKKGPENETKTDEIFVIVNKNSTECGYYSNSTLLRMNKIGVKFTARPDIVPGYNEFKIMCKDSEGNKIRETIGFYYIK